MTQEWDSILQQNVKHYSELTKIYSDTHKVLGWGSKASQRKRFSILTKIANLNNQNILDVGCGLADFWEYLQDNNIWVDYTGIDIVPKIISLSKDKYPELKIFQHDIVNTPLPEAYDYVFASGIFTYILDSISLFHKLIENMFSACKKGLAFNVLSTYASVVEKGEFYASPSKTLDFALSLTPYVELSHSYMQHDFTIFMYKKDNIKC